MPFRILSLDGGGVWALIQVHALMALYDPSATGHQVLSDFDLVASNSGGSIVLGGLVEDLPLSTIQFYFEDEQRRRAIFGMTDKVFDRVLHDLIGLGPKYSTEALLAVLEAHLPRRGPLPLPDAARGIKGHSSGEDVHLLVMAYDFDRDRAAFFRSARASGPGWGDGASSKATLAQAIQASANAPVNYFDEPAVIGGRRYWDGGIAGCNNPVLAAVAEAQVLGHAPDEIVALSIGTATNALPGPLLDHPPTPYTQPRSDQGLVPDLRKVATSIVEDPPDIATFLAHVMTGGSKAAPAGQPSRIVRLNPLISPQWDETQKTWVAPGGMTEAQFKYLATKIGLDAIPQQQVDFISSYAQYWLRDLTRNQPIRMDTDTLAPEVGFDRFSQAVASWKAIR